MNYSFWKPCDPAFNVHQQHCKAIAHQLLAKYPPHALDEQAVPSYIQGNFLSRWLFWRRQIYCFNYLQHFSGGNAMDFGCGIGVMLPLLQKRFECVYGVDIDAQYTREFIQLQQEAVGEPLSKVSIAETVTTASIPDHSLDLILAFDVLEHVENSEDILAQFASRLKPNGKILISGPTENWFYRLGRAIVGFSGHYHKRNIRDIMVEMEKFFDVRIAKRLIVPIELFWILEAENRSQ